MTSTTAERVATVMERYEAVIGIEIHCQLRTASKMFCACSTAYDGAAPNTHTCPVCLGLPGALPVINRLAVEYVIATGLAIDATTPERTQWERKNYFYPDLPKGYQISQYAIPLAAHGQLAIETSEGPFTVPITRAHLEEDTAKLVHADDARGGSGGAAAGRATNVDFNRSGAPLMEIVTEPEIRTAEQARRYAEELQLLLRAIGASDADMERGQMRVEANVSLRPRGTEAFGTRVEVKNMNSFRAVHDALVFEQGRQAEVLRSGGTIPQETRGWVDERSVTVSQRSKEEAHDYRYFPEPDLPPLRLSRDWVARVGAKLPELPAKRKERLLALGLSEDEAVTLTESRERAEDYDATRAALGDNPRAAKLAANWVLSEALRWSNVNARDLDALPIGPGQLAELILMVEGKAITSQVAKDVFEAMAESGKGAKEIVDERGLGAISGTDELRGIVRRVIASNEKAVADYRAGKEASLKFLLGQVMRETKGRATPQVAQELIAMELAE